MSSNNFWNNFTFGFMHGMFGNSPMFGGGWLNGFMPSFGCCNQFNSCFSAFQDNSLLYTYPNVFSSMSFAPLMPNISMPAMPAIPENAGKLFSDNIWQFQGGTSLIGDTFTAGDTGINSNLFSQTFTMPQVAFSPYIDSGTTNNSSTTESSTNTASTSSSNSTGQNRKLTEKYNGTAAQLNKKLNKKNGVLKNKGQVFLDAQARYGINAAILVAICINESDYGTSKKARKQNNVGGVSKGKGFKTYNSVDECIMDMARFLKEKYVDKGIVTIAHVGKKYCPVGDPRDTKGLNGGWGDAVSSITSGIMMA